MEAALTGVVPVVPTIFHDDETIDLDGTARVVDYLMDAGAGGLCLASETGAGRILELECQSGWADYSASACAACGWPIDRPPAGSKNCR
jgi:dihydrodipicolinate synthase/N-acetylneuraminate lyase